MVTVPKRLFINLITKDGKIPGIKGINNRDRAYLRKRPASSPVLYFFLFIGLIPEIPVIFPSAP